MSGRLVVTGASGLVGLAVVRHAAQGGIDVLGLGRRHAPEVERAGGRFAAVEALSAGALRPHLAGAAAVIHLANIGVEREGASFEQVNVEGSRALVAAAREAGVPRVVYLSGLGVARYGQSRRVTNRYFLSKLQAELALLGSGLEAVVLRPSWVLGPGSALVASLVGELEAGRVEVAGDGRQRLQPVAVADAAAAAVAAAQRREDWPLVFDLVGPESIDYLGFVARVAGRVAARQAAPAPDWSPRFVAEQEAERRAAAGGYRGMGPEELDCLLCDEVASPRPLERLLGRPLAPLDRIIDAALAG